MKKILIIFFLLIPVSLLFWWIQVQKPVSGNPSPVDFVIPKGTSAASVGQKLFEEKLIRSALAFKIYVQATGKQNKIPTGEYQLFANLSLKKIFEKLEKGPTQLWVTIPEGLRLEEVAQKIIEGLGKKETSTETFYNEFIGLAKAKEGYLFPDTYLFPKDVTAQIVVNKLTNTFDKKITEQMKADLTDSERTLNQAVILASILERETKTDEERPLVSGILLKRLKAGWPLQVDATVQYAVAGARCKLKGIECKYWEPLLKEDLGIKSPYNSYKYQGLPPTPICNPGLSSLNAAIYPTDSPYWFYLHESNGKIHFAKTIEEHNQNISKYLGK